MWRQECAHQLPHWRSDQINSSRLKYIFQDGKFVFTPTQSLDGLEAVIMKHNQKPQYYRQDRFPELQSQLGQC